ncbi:MAG: T9SS type A sorting domain-containing protein [Saprospiraceae bacterium]|nr:T9SS type A sorting domain-containing protein [Saprospiraceae bacterium]
MRRLTLIFLTMLSAGMAHAQLYLEHTYPGTVLARMAHHTMGSLYVLHQNEDQSRTYLFYDSTHHLVQSTQITAPASFAVRVSHQVSSDFFDDDPGVEILQFWSDGNLNDAYGYVYDDDGTVLGGPMYIDEYLFFITQLELKNGGKHLLIGNRVFNAQTFQLVHAIEDNLSRNALAYRTDTLDWKYIYLNNSGAFTALNADFSLFQSYTFGLADFCDYSFIMAEQTTIDPDSDFEFLLVSNCTGGQTFKLYSGEDLLTSITDVDREFASIGLLLPDSVSGITSPKLLVNKYLQNLSRMYDLESGQLEFVRDEALTRFRLNNGVSVLMDSKMEEGPDSFYLYKPNNEVFTAYTRLIGGVVVVYDVSNTTFDDNPATTEVVARYVNTSQVKVQSDDGTILLAVDSAGYTAASKLKGQKSKLFVHRTGIGPQGEVQVYGRIADMVVEPEPPVSDQKIQLWPNPASQMVTINLQAFETTISSLRILDANGQVVWEKTSLPAGVSEEIQIGAWSLGQYVVAVVSDGQTTSRVFLKM